MTQTATTKTKTQTFTVEDLKAMKPRDLFPDATLFSSHLWAGETVKESIRKIKSRARVVASVAEYKLRQIPETETGGLIVWIDDTNAAFVSRISDVAYVMLDGAAFPFDMEIASQELSRRLETEDQIRENRWREVQRDINRIASERPSRQRDVAIEALRGVQSRIG
ncbi:MAG: hypothetical protein KJ947_10415 [Alphaproteobacteria bacterium]|nr:hypothetical protein [Alphaproteobacteria bacterium]MBU1549972.1 hypothetical protein [Alphaproteobacteria bacterium]MBU2336572.1 hypothetical protein [Alphaproteobacteria bacterium]MBU2387305.1 hypothetical protein [Alphaproteobacteria bacterium]